MEGNIEAQMQAKGLQSHRKSLHGNVLPNHEYKPIFTPVASLLVG